MSSSTSLRAHFALAAIVRHQRLSTRSGSRNERSSVVRKRRLERDARSLLPTLQLLTLSIPRQATPSDERGLEVCWWRKSCRQQLAIEELGHVLEKISAQPVGGMYVKTSQAKFAVATAAKASRAARSYKELRGEEAGTSGGGGGKINWGKEAKVLEEAESAARKTRYEAESKAQATIQKAGMNASALADALGDKLQAPDVLDLAATHAQARRWIQHENGTALFM